MTGGTVEGADHEGQSGITRPFGPIRPRFRLTVPGTVEQQIALVEAAVARPDSRCVSRVLGHHVDITVVTEDRHRWSPCVQLEFRQSDGDTIIDGLVGPHPNLWTMFAFVYITVAVAAGFGLMMGLAQLWLGQSAWGLWAGPVGAAMMGGMYLVSQAGQRLAVAQTQRLTRLVEDALKAECDPS